MRSLEVIGQYGLPKYNYDGYIGNTSVVATYGFGYDKNTESFYSSFQPGDIAIMVTSQYMETSASGWSLVYTTASTNMKFWKKNLTAGDLSPTATWSKNPVGSVKYEFMHGLVLRTTSGASGLYSPNSAADFFFAWNGSGGGIPAFYQPGSPYSDLYQVPALTKSSFDGSDQYQRVDFMVGTSDSGYYTSGYFTTPDYNGFDYYSNFTDVNRPTTTLGSFPSTRPYSPAYEANQEYIGYGSWASQFLVSATSNLAGPSIVWSPQRYQCQATVATLTFWVRKKSGGGGVLL